MEKLELVKPNLKYATQIQCYKEGFLKAGDDLAGSSFLETTDLIEGWIKNVSLFFDKETVPAGFAYGDTWLVICQTDQKLIGMTNLRAELTNEYLKKFGGHIGYSVDPEERKKDMERRYFV